MAVAASGRCLAQGPGDVAGSRVQLVADLVVGLRAPAQVSDLLPLRTRALGRSTLRDPPGSPAPGAGSRAAGVPPSPGPPRPPARGWAAGRPAAASGPAGATARQWQAASAPGRRRGAGSRPALYLPPRAHPESSPGKSRISRRTASPPPVMTRRRAVPSRTARPPSPALAPRTRPCAGSATARPGPARRRSQAGLPRSEALWAGRSGQTSRRGARGLVGVLPLRPLSGFAGIRIEADVGCHPGQT